MPRERIRLGDRVEVLDRAKWRCWFCGRVLERGGGTVTCLMPPARGGTTQPDNLCAACTTCSAAKNGKTVEEYRHWLWTRLSPASRTSTQLAGLLRRELGLPAFHRAEIAALAARLALSVPRVRFFGETSADAPSTTR